jgi:hypothetical protein
MLLVLVQWQHRIQAGTGLLVIAFGVFRPRFLSGTDPGICGDPPP